MFLKSGCDGMKCVWHTTDMVMLCAVSAELASVSGWFSNDRPHGASKERSGR